MTFNKKSFLFIIWLALIVSGCSRFNTTEPEIKGLKFINKYEDGQLYRTTDNKINVLVLEGSFRDMGRQYGKLVKDDIVSFYELAYGYLTDHGITDDSIAEFVKWLKINQPQQINEIIYGMSETSTLTMEQQFVCSNFLRMVNTPLGTTFAAWDDYTSKEPLLVGHSWDTEREFFGNLNRYTSVIIYKPKGTGHSVAEINFAGTVWFQTGLNNMRLYFDIHSGILCDSSFYPEKTPVNHILFQFLFDYATMEAVNTPLLTMQTDRSIILHAADVNKSHVYQCPTFGVNRREGFAEDVIISTNYFHNFPEYWTLNEIPESNLKNGWTNVRRTNAINYLSNFNGEVNVEVFKDFFNLDIDQNGVSFMLNPYNQTVYQIIVKPVELELNIRIPDYTVWHTIDLHELFEL